MIGVLSSLQGRSGIDDQMDDTAANFSMYMTAVINSLFKKKKKKRYVDIEMVFAMLS